MIFVTFMAGIPEGGENGGRWELSQAGDAGRCDATATVLDASFCTAGHPLARGLGLGPGRLPAGLGHRCRARQDGRSVQSLVTTGSARENTLSQSWNGSGTGSG